MPFVEACIGHRDDQSGESPVPPPASSSGAHAAKYCGAKEAEFCDVRQFANTYMHEVEHSTCGRRKEPVQDWKDDPAGLLIGKEARREDRNQDGDKNRRKPIAESRPACRRVSSANSNQEQEPSFVTFKIPRAFMRTRLRIIRARSRVKVGDPT